MSKPKKKTTTRNEKSAKRVFIKLDFSLISESPPGSSPSSVKRSKVKNSTTQTGSSQRRAFPATLKKTATRGKPPLSPKVPALAEKDDSESPFRIARRSSKFRQLSLGYILDFEKLLKNE
jgi:hypothetical protein